MKRTFVLIIAVIFVIPLIGCDKNDPAVTDKGKQNNQPTVTHTVEEFKQKVDELWSARVEADCETQFKFLNPALQKESSVEDYVKYCQESEPFEFIEYKLFEVQLENNMGWADIERTLRVRKMPTAPRTVRNWEKWKFTDNIWIPVHVKDLENFPEPPSRRDLDKEKALKARFLESFEFRKNREWKEFFKMLDPRDIKDKPYTELEELLDEYLYLKQDLLWCQVIGDYGKVRSNFLIKINDPNIRNIDPIPQGRTELWVLHDGEWYIDVEP